MQNIVVWDKFFQVHTFLYQLCVYFLENGGKQERLNTIGRETVKERFGFFFKYTKKNVSQSGL